MMSHSFEIPLDQIAAFCRARGIRRLALFGSFLHGDAGSESDVDLLVDFEPGRVPGLAFFEMQEELGRILGRTVDLNTPGFLDPAFRERVAAEARPLYVTA